MPALRKLLRRAALVAVAVAVALGLLEVGVRLLWSGPDGGYPPGLFVADSATGFRLAPDYRARHVTPVYDIEIATNARGFRALELGPKAADTLRVLALGDSFAFGHGVEQAEAYPAVLETLLDTEAQRVEVLNLGAPGYGTHNARALFEAEFEALAPDAVVLGFYVGNDFRDNHLEKFGRLTAHAGMLLTESTGESMWSVLGKKAVLSWQSLQLLFLMTASEEQLSEQQVFAALREDLPWNAGFGTAMTRREWSEDAERAFEVTTGELRGLADACAERGVRLLVALLPAPYQYHDALWKIVVDKCQLDAADYDMARPNRELSRWAEEQGIELLDLLPSFRDAAVAGPADRLYLDVHFSAEGHRLAAELLAEKLRD